jgi:hypothetical protein
VCKITWRKIKEAMRKALSVELSEPSVSETIVIELSWPCNFLSYERNIGEKAALVRRRLFACFL